MKHQHICTYKYVCVLCVTSKTDTPFYKIETFHNLKGASQVEKKDVDHQLM